MELRSPSGIFDDFLATDPAVTGVSLRLAGTYGIGVRTRLIDTQPATATFADAPLQPGRTFTDPASGIAITTLSAAAGLASVQVVIPGSPLPTTSTDPLPAPAPIAPPTDVPPGTPLPPVAAPAAATMTLRRISAERSVLRVGLPAPAGASRCAIRVGTRRWSSCRVAGGRIALSRSVAFRRGLVPVAVRVDDEILVTARLRLPRPGSVTKVVRPLRVV
jgi:hypothetical protein